MSNARLVKPLRRTQTGRISTSAEVTYYPEWSQEAMGQKCLVVKRRVPIYAHWSFDWTTREEEIKIRVAPWPVKMDVFCVEYALVKYREHYNSYLKGPVYTWKEYNYTYLAPANHKNVSVREALI